MVKKDKPADANPSPASPLKHSPFASLLGKKPEGAVPEGPGATSQRERSHEPARAPRAAEPERKVAPTEPAAAAPRPERYTQVKSRGRVVLRRETKHRGGKAVIIVRGLALLPGFDGPAIEALAKQLKQQLGCGGTVEGSADQREIVLQGDRAAQVAALLRAQGFRVEGVTS